MLHPPDVFDCEARYVAQLNTEIDYLKKQNQDIEQANMSEDTDDFKIDIRKIINSVSSASS